ncbi:hypothetical protein CLU85_2898 [Acidovorax sp. 69]|nr:hypothetical protein CLU85_2898 [Acidovorax sp. 69]
MRNMPLLRAAMFSAGMLLLSADYAHAAYASVVPQVPVSAIGTGAANVARITGGVVSAGYVFTTGVLQLGAYNLGQVVVPIAFRVAAGVAVAGLAGTALLTGVAAGVALGAAAPYVIDWITRAHSDGVAMDLYYDAQTDMLRKSAVPPAGHNYNGIDINATMMATGTSLAVEMTNMASHYPYACYTAPHTWVRIADGSAGACAPGAKLLVVVCTATTDYSYEPCTGSAGVVMDSGVAVSGSDLNALSTVAVDPRILPALGQPIPVDPTPVMNPPAPAGNDPLPIGPNSPAVPTLPSQPLRIADGEPIPIPNTSPQQYTQPWQEIVAAPTATDPYRVDVRPITTIVDTPTAPTTPVTVPTPVTGNPTPGTNYLTDCDKYPGSLGCMPVGAPPPDGTIPTQTRNITQQQGPSFGGGGSCPANLNINVGGHSITALNMAQPCGWIVNYIKPILLLLAAISAVFIVAPRSEG